MSLPVCNVFRLLPLNILKGRGDVCFLRRESQATS